MTVLMFFATVLLISRDLNRDSHFDNLRIFTANLLEVSYELVLLWFIQRFVDIAADARAEERDKRFNVPSASFFYEDIQENNDPEQLGVDLLSIVPEKVNTQARQVMNAFVAYPKGVDPGTGLAKREKKHGTEYRND